MNNQGIISTIAGNGYNAGTGDGFSVLSWCVYRSQDGGAHWSSVNVNNGLFSPNPAPPQFYSVKQFAYNPNVSGDLYAATSTGLYHTTSSQGSSCNWNLVTSSAFPSNNQYFQDVKFHPPTPGTMYASGTDIYKSADNGVTWNSMTGSSTGLDLSNGINSDGTTIQSINIAVTPNTSGLNYVYASIYTQGVNYTSCSNHTCNMYYYLFYFGIVKI